MQENSLSVLLFVLRAEVIKKYQKTPVDVFFGACADYLSFHPQHPCNHKTIERHLKDLILPFHFFRKKITIVMPGTTMSPV